MSYNPEDVLGGLMPLSAYAEAIRRQPRTVSRWISRGLPIVRIGQEPFIDPVKALEWFGAGCPAAPTRPDRQPRPRRAGK
ncbi:MAG: hypothetical protein ACREFK_11505 [Stellaceae bacterium]